MTAKGHKEDQEEPAFDGLFGNAFPADHLFRSRNEYTHGLG